MSKRPPLDFPSILQSAQGNWLTAIFPSVGITFKGNPNHHQPCPLCGGNDRFRCDNKNGEGTWICNNCGAGKGYTLVKKYTGAETYDIYSMIANALGIDGTQAVSDEQKQAWKQQQIEKDRKEKEQKKQARINASVTAQKLWKQATQADLNHPYAVKKQIYPSGMKQLDNRLLIPMFYHNCQSKVTTLVNLQSIASDGDKRFIKGGLTKYCYTFLNSDTLHNNIILIAEGYATAMSIIESLDYQYPCIVAFNANNLTPVAQSIRNQFPNHRIIICADNDKATEEKTGVNVGIKKATEAGEAIGGDVVYPNFTNQIGLTTMNIVTNKLSDFNDLAVICGKKEVAKQINAVIGGAK